MQAMLVFYHWYRNAFSNLLVRRSALLEANLPDDCRSHQYSRSRELTHSIPFISPIRSIHSYAVCFGSSDRSGIAGRKRDKRQLRPLFYHRSRSSVRDVSFICRGRTRCGGSVQTHASCSVRREWAAARLGGVSQPERGSALRLRRPSRV